MVGDLDDHGGVLPVCARYDHCQYCHPEYHDQHQRRSQSDPMGAHHLYDRHGGGHAHDGLAERLVGHKWLYTGSLVVFTLSSVLCGMAWSPASLIFFRCARTRRWRHRPDCHGGYFPRLSPAAARPGNGYSLGWTFGPILGPTLGGTSPMRLVGGPFSTLTCPWGSSVWSWR